MELVLIAALLTALLFSLLILHRERKYQRRNRKVGEGMFSLVEAAMKTDK